MSDQEERHDEQPVGGQEAAEQAGPYGEGGEPGKTDQEGEWADAAGPYGEGGEQTSNT